MHDDRDCEQWIESEGCMSKESQQFGPWIRAPPFFPSRKHVIKIPGFYTRRGKETATAPPPTASKPLVVVVHIGKPSPEIIWPEKESLVNMQQLNKGMDFQEDIPQFPIPNTIDMGILGNSNLKAINVEESR